jgi:hypothetical protein
MIWNSVPQPEPRAGSDVLLSIPWCYDGGEPPRDLFEIVCRYYGYPASRSPWWDLDAASSARSFVERAAHVGLRAHVLRGSSKCLFQWLQDGILPLARLHTNGHATYVAVTGVRNSTDCIRIGTTVADQRWISMRDFQRQWRRAGSEAILITERPVIAARGVSLPAFNGAMPLSTPGLAA